MSDIRTNGSVPVIRVRMLGEFQLSAADGTVLALDSVRMESLIAYLLLHQGTPHSRRLLAFRFWPDSTEAQALTNLRHLLHQLRRTLPDLDGYLDITARTLRWRSETAHWSDVAEFERALSTAEAQTGAARLLAQADAVDRYTGDLLAASYEDWVQPERERLRARYVNATCSGWRAGNPGANSYSRSSRSSPPASRISRMVRAPVSRVRTVPSGFHPTPR